MADFNYHDLPLSQDDRKSNNARRIRLLEVKHGMAEHGMISCSLSVAELSTTLEYKALSYVWGPKHPQYTIMVNGKILRIRQNLYEFLSLATNGHNYPSSSTSLWIDAICIDQTSTRERNEQVAFMSEIYRRARHVFVWLGSSEKRIGNALDEIGQPQHHESQHDILLAPETLSLSVDPRNGTLTKYERRNYYNPIVAGLQALFNLDYWERLWVVQEYRLSGGKTFLYGHSTVSDEYVFQCLGWYHRLQTVYPGIVTTPVTLAHRLCTDFTLPGRLQESPPTLARALLLHQHGKCTDFHDRIYALRSISPLGDLLPVNYAVDKIGLMLEVLIFCCEELFSEHATLALLERFDDYLKLSANFATLLGIQPPKFSDTLPRKSTLYGDREGRGLPCFYIDHAQDYRTIELDDYRLRKHGPVLRNSIHQVERYVTQNFRCENESLSLHRKFVRTYGPEDVYFLTSAAIVLICPCKSAGQISYLIRYHTQGDSQQPHIEYYPNKLKGVKIVSVKPVNNKGGRLKHSSRLLFENPRLGTVAGVVLFGLSLDLALRTECLSRLDLLSSVALGSPLGSFDETETKPIPSLR